MDPPMFPCVTQMPSKPKPGGCTHKNNEQLELVQYLHTAECVS